MKYNYIIGTIGGFYDVAFDEIRHLENVRYYSSHLDCFSSKWAKLLCRLNFSRKVNRIIREPFRHFVNKRLYHSELLDRPNTCIVLLGRLTYVFNSSFIAYIRTKYPHVKLILYCADIVDRTYYLDIERAKQIFDLVISYDQGDAEKYGLLYCPTPYSKIDIGASKSEQYDLYFCGHAKNRYEEILEFYETARRLNMSCDFYLYGVPKDQQKHGIDIHYDVPMSYIENVRRLQQSRAILEVMQQTAVGYTPRLWEAITYNKYFITNNPNLTDSLYFYRDAIFYGKDALQDLKNRFAESVSYPQRLKTMISPIHFLDYIGENL